MSSDPTREDSLTTTIPVGVRALHLALLVGIGIAQPLYDLLGRNPAFFVAHSATTIDLIGFAIIVSMAAPLVLWLFQWVLTRIAPRTGSAVYLVLVATLFTSIAAVPVKRLFPESGALALAAAMIIGLAATVAYARFPALRSVMSFLAPSALIFPLLLVFFSGANEIMGSDEGTPTQTTGVKSMTPVVLIVFDEFPVTSMMNEQRLVDPIAFPNFAKFAAHSHWFRNATTVAQNTTYAVPAILTGRFPDATRAPHARAYPENLFTFLAGSHEIRAIEIFSRLCPDEINAAMVEREPFGQRMRAQLTDSAVVYLHIVLPSKLTTALPAIDSTWRDFGREDDHQTALDPHAHSYDSTWISERFLRFATPTADPTLFFLHLNLPHLPWKYLPSGREYMFKGAPIRPHGFGQGPWSTQRWEVIQGWQRHLLQLGYADRILGRIIEHLQQTHLWNDSLIIITSDHGASFQPGEERRAATPESAADVLGVPLMIKAPGQREPRLHDTSARTIDILATIADVLDADLPWATDGHSLFDGTQSEPATVVIHRNDGNALGDHLELPNQPEEKYRTLARKLEIFGAGKPLESLYSIGEFGHLVGRGVEELGTASGAEFSLLLADAWAFENIDLDGAFLPAQIEGRLISREPVDRPIDLAVAVNGTIRASTKTYSLPEETDFSSFSAMVSESAFVRGRNLITVFHIEQDSDGVPRLRPIRSDAEFTYALDQVEEGGTATILRSDKRTIAVRPGAIHIVVNREEDTISGVAFEAATTRPADSILVFSGKKFLFSADVWLPTPSLVAKYHSESMAKAGYRFTVPATYLDDDPDGLRIFAVTNSTATEFVQPKSQIESSSN